MPPGIGSDRAVPGFAGGGGLPRSTVIALIAGRSPRY